MDDEVISLDPVLICRLLAPKSWEMEALRAAAAATLLMDGDRFTLMEAEDIVRLTVMCCISGDVECLLDKGDEACSVCTLVLLMMVFWTGLASRM